MFFRINIVVIGLSIFAWSTNASGQHWGHHGGHIGGHFGGHHGGHFGGHIDYHQPSHLSFHNGHWDVHQGHVDHILSSPIYPSTAIYPSAPLYSPVVGSPPAYVSGGILTTPSPVISTSPVVAPRPAVVTNLPPSNLPPSNALPTTTVTTGYTPNQAPITIVNPSQFATSLSMKLNGTTVRLEPGQQYQLKFDRNYTVEFDRAGGFGTAKYSLRDGNYVFFVGEKRLGFGKKSGH